MQSAVYGDVMVGVVSGPTIEELIEQHHALLYRYAWRLCGSAADAEDLTQQTYLIAHQNLHQLREASSAKSWLCTILRHAYLRHRSRTPPTQPLDDELHAAGTASATDIDEEALQHALNQLTEDYRSAVILYYFQDLSYQEISTVLGIPLGTVMSRLARAKSQLKSRLEWRATQQVSRKTSVKLVGVSAD